MSTILVAMVLAVASVAGQTGAAEEAAVLSTVSRFVDSFNKGDTKAAAAACAEQTSIIDDFPPHEWHGVAACLTWLNDYDADAKKNAITDGFVTLGKPRHIDITGERAYLVAPADYVYKKDGKPVKETGSMLALALRKDAPGWRITGWSWAKN